ncbi:MAG: CoA pyrophosphatase [Bacteroidota bacterium]
MKSNYIQNIRNEFQKPLPGLLYQAKMAPVTRLNDYNPNPPGARKGGVLLLLYFENNKLYITFIKRAEDGGVHSGQISFPGGKYEPEDKSLIQTAKRETFEEIGVSGTQVEIIGNLSTLYIPVSNYIVHPAVGFTKSVPQFIPNETEVKKIIVIPLEQFLSENNIHAGEIIVRKHKVKTPFYKMNEYKIWGATAMIMSEFTEIVKRSKK